MPRLQSTAPASPSAREQTDDNSSRVRQRVQRQQGLCLTECLVWMAITGVLAGLALSSFSALIHWQRLHGSTQELMHDLYWVRSQAVSQQQNMHLKVSALETGSCYLAHTGAPHSCTCSPTGQALCQAGSTALKTVFLPGTSVRLSANSSTMLFDPGQGTVTPAGTLRLQSPSGQALRIVVNMMGRVRTCSESASFSGYPRCTSNS